MSLQCRFEQEISGNPGDALPHGFTPPGLGHPPTVSSVAVPSRPPGATVSVPGMTTASLVHQGNHGNKPSITATIRGFVPKPQMLTSVRPEGE